MYSRCDTVLLMVIATEVLLYLRTVGAIRCALRFIVVIATEVLLVGAIGAHFSLICLLILKYCCTYVQSVQYGAAYGQVGAIRYALWSLLLKYCCIYVQSVQYGAAYGHCY